MSSEPVSLSPPRGDAPVVYDSSARPHPFVEEWIDLYQYRDLVAQWSVRNITLRYKRSALGILWTIIEPLMLMTILTVVFSRLFRFPSVGHYPVYLLSGLLLWDFFRRSTLQIVEETIASQSLAERIHVPRSAFAVASIASFLVNWVLALIPLFAIMLYFDVPFRPAIVTLPIAMLLNAFFALGVGLIVATIGAFFHDVHLTYQVLLTAWLYLTPIIYPIDIIQNPRVLQLFQLNPLLHLCEIARVPIFQGTVAPGIHWAIATCTSVGVLAIGWWMFTHWRNAFDYRT